MAFQEKLKLGLSLTQGGQSFSIPGGQVKHFALRLANHGFTASVTFWTSLEKEDAPLFAAFREPALLQAHLSVEGSYGMVRKPPPPLTVQGVVRTRSIGALHHGPLAGEDRAFRRYSIELADAAQVLWRQHRPIELHTRKSMKDLLDAHKAGPIQLEYDWSVLQEEQPLLCLALGADDARTSFYDFLLWYVQARNGVWTYDSRKDRYLVSGTMPSGGRAARLDRREVERVEVQLPRTLRHGTRVHNALAAGPSTVALTQKQAAQGIWHDVLLRTPIAEEAEHRQKLEKSRLQVRQRQLHVSFRQLPTVDVRPGVMLRLEGGLWNAALTGSKDDHRVIALELEGQALEAGPHDEQQSPDAGYQLEMGVRLEPKSERVPTFPAYRAPRYPIHVEAKVHSPGGGQDERTWFAPEDEKTSLTHFQMTVPLWNKTVSVPAEPGFFTGHFYFPPYKNARVLLALYFDRAELRRFLDWGEGVRLPQDGQGDHLLLGKNEKSQTSISHDYQSDNPVWSLRRVSSGDTQTIRFGEGSLLIKVEEKPGSQKATPTFDVTPKVEEAKGELTSAVGGAIGETSAAFQGAVADVNTRIASATSEAMEALASARAEVQAKVAEARSALTGLLGALSGKSEQLAGSAAEARAALEKLR